MSVWSPSRHAIAPSGDVAPSSSSSSAEPLTIGDVAMGTALGSLVFWTGVIVAGVVLERALSTPAPVQNPFARWGSFDACERDAQARGVRDPGAYCGAIARRAGTR
jgi:hypothetical protein